MQRHIKTGCEDDELRRAVQAQPAAGEAAAAAAAALPANDMPHWRQGGVHYGWL